MDDENGEDVMVAWFAMNRLREKIAQDIEKQVDQDWPNDDIADAYRHAAYIARNGLK